MDIQEMIFEIKGDEQGSLVPMESLRNIPFDIKRIYYITNTKQGVVRGHHAHRELKQVLVCVHGSCKISLDDGTEKKRWYWTSIIKEFIWIPFCGEPCMIFRRMPCFWFWLPHYMTSPIT